MPISIRLNIFIENYLPGGLERFCWDLINGLPAEFEVTLLANSIAGVADRVAAAVQRPIDFQLYRVDTATRLDYEWLKANRSGGSMLLRRAFKAVTRWPLHARSRAQLRSILQPRPADMLHIINGGYPGAEGCLLAAQMGRELRFPKVLMSILSYPYPRRTVLDARLDRQVAQAVDLLAPNSAAAGRGLIELRGFAPDRIQSIASGTPPPPVDLQAGAQLRAELGLPADSLIVGTVAALEPMKGHLTLLEAITQLQHEFPHVYFVFSGEGVMRPQIEDFIRRQQLNNRVYLLGFTDARAITNAFDAVAFPSFYEGMPFAILEAMALGKPIVASAVGGIPEEIEDGVSGWLTPPRDSAALAAALRRLLGSFEQARVMGAAGRDRYNRLFTVQHMVDAYIKLYTTL